MDTNPKIIKALNFEDREFETAVINTFNQVGKIEFPRGKDNYLIITGPSFPVRA